MLVEHLILLKMIILFLERNVSSTTFNVCNYNLVIIGRYLECNLVYCSINLFILCYLSGTRLFDGFFHSYYSFFNSDRISLHCRWMGTRRISIQSIIFSFFSHQFKSVMDDYERKKLAFQ